MQAAGAKISLRYVDPIAVVGLLHVPALVSTTSKEAFSMLRDPSPGCKAMADCCMPCHAIGAWT